MRSRSLTRIMGLVSLGVLLVGWMPAAAQGPARVELPLVPPQAQPVQYSVPYVCGWLPSVPPDDDRIAKPGDYATAINIHNPTLATVLGSKRVAFFYAMGTTPPPVFPAFAISVFRLRVLEVDCADIWTMLGVPPGTFVTGAVHIGLATQLPVAAIYTSQTHANPLSGPDAGAGISIDVEDIPPFLP